MVYDFKDKNGNWRKSYTVNGISYQTRSGVLWNGMNDRCNPNGTVQKNNPTYIGCTNEFYSFHEFSEWCQSQYGYLIIEKSGKLWQLDKDLLSVGNKIYSMDTCIFVPCRVNTLLNSRRTSRGEYPIGVNWIRRDNKFAASCNDGSGKQKGLGSFNTPMEAHQAWQKAKIDRIQSICNDTEIKLHTKLLPALQIQLELIKQDLQNGVETIR